MKKEKKNIFLLLFIIILFLLLILLLFIQNRDIKRILNYAEKVKIGEKAYTFKVRSIMGKEIDIRNKDVLLIFFSTTCGNCNREGKNWNKFLTEGNIFVVGITTDPYTSVKKFLRRIKLSFPILIDHSKIITNKYKVNFYPFFVMINKDRKIIFTNHRKQNTKDVFEEIEKISNKLLNMRGDAPPNKGGEL